MKIAPSELELVGGWVNVGGRVEADSVAKRIDGLVSTYLRRVATDDTGWNHLYLDPSDGRLWEVVYPHSDWHGGGPPTLRVVSIEHAKQRYGWVGSP